MPDESRLTRRPDRRPLHLVAALVVALVAAVPLDAGADVGRWTVRAEGLLVSPANDRVPARIGGTPAPTATYAIDGDGSGFGLGLEYRLGRRLGLEGEIASVDLDAVLRTESDGGATTDGEAATFELYLVGAVWHLVPDRRLDVAIGGFAAMTKLGDLVFRHSGDEEKLTFDDDVGFGVSVAVAWPFTPDGRWLLGGRVRYLKTILESDSGSLDLDLDPLLVSAGLAYRF